MNFCLGSAFRNSGGRQIQRYFRQAADLRETLGKLGHGLFLGLVEGDSEDDTRRQLVAAMAGYRGSLVDRSHGGPVYGSTEDPARFRALQGVGNGILESVPGDADVLVYVESDLIWDAETILGLAGRLCDRVDVVAPLIFAGELFYDVFAFRGLDGARFSPFRPFHVSLADGRQMGEVQSAGSCLVMKADVARTCRVPPDDGLVGFCREARAQGHRVWADTVRIVRHPA